MERPYEILDFTEHANPFGSREFFDIVVEPPIVTTLALEIATLVEDAIKPARLGDVDPPVGSHVRGIAQFAFEMAARDRQQALEFAQVERGPGRRAPPARSGGAVGVSASESAEWPEAPPATSPGCNSRVAEIMGIVFRSSTLTST
jgi:hypothetical protein